MLSQKDNIEILRYTTHTKLYINRLRKCQYKVMEKRYQNIENISRTLKILVSNQEG